MVQALEQTSDERVAILLHSLQPDLRKQILSALPTERVSAVNELVQEIETSGIDLELQSEVLTEFERMMRFAVAQREARQAEEERLRLAEQATDDATSDEGGGTPADRTGEPRPPFVPTGDPFLDLKQLSAYQIARSLDGEQPQTAALVLKQLPATQSATIIPLLPEETRGDVFLHMNRDDMTAPPLVERIVKATLGRALEIEEPEGEELDADGRAALLLRSLEKGPRNEMLAALEKDDKAMADRVRGLLYEFEDILRLTGRSVQKLLGEFDVETLSAALKGSSQELIEIVQSNLSKRARERLVEELELASSDPDTIGAARKQVAEAMGKLDQAGELQMN